MRSEGDDRDVPRFWICFQPARYFPPTHFRKADVHKNQVWINRGRHEVPLLSVVSSHNFISPSLQAPGEHVPVHLVIFHQEDLWHLNVSFSFRLLVWGTPEWHGHIARSPCDRLNADG